MDVRRWLVALAFGVPLGLALAGGGVIAQQIIYGTAGSPAGQVVSVQGVASGTAINVQQATAANLKVDLSGTGANATAIKTDGSGVTQPVSGTVSVNALPTGSNTIGKVDILGNAGAAMDAAGQNATSPANELLTACQFNTTPTTIVPGNVSPVQCTNAGSLIIHPDGTVTVSGTVTANQGSPPWQFQGDVAAGSANSGNPLQDGGVAHTALPTAVSDGQRMSVMTDKFGRVAVTGADRALVTTCPSVTVNSTTETTLCSAGGAGVFLDLKAISCTNNSATLVRVDIRDSTAGTVQFSRALAASGGGFIQSFADVPYKQTTANNNWTIQLSSAVTDVRCDAIALQNK